MIKHLFLVEIAGAVYQFTPGKGISGWDTRDECVAKAKEFAANNYPNGKWNAEGPIETGMGYLRFRATNEHKEAVVISFCEVHSKH